MKKTKLIPTKKENSKASKTMTICKTAFITRLEQLKTLSIINWIYIQISTALDFRIKKKKQGVGRNEIDGRKFQIWHEPGGTVNSTNTMFTRQEVNL